MKQLERVLIMAGGTGGHVFPGLAIARVLRDKGVSIRWLGTQRGLEAKLVPAEGIPLDFLSVSGIRGKKGKALFLAPFYLLIAVYQAIQVIFTFRPNVIVGMGGFVSGPGGIAAWLMRYPLIIHEQNARAGTTNRYLARVARRVLQAFPDTFAASRKVLTVGNPVRAEITASASSDFLKKDEVSPPCRPLRLLVLGGSQGALAVNEIVPRALAELPAGLRPEVLHQAGEKHFSVTLTQYQKAGVQAEVVPFINEMSNAYAWSDIVLSRAGALTVAELCMAARGAILVPFPAATDDHQTANAGFMLRSGAAIVIPQSELNESSLAMLLLELQASPERCKKMGELAFSLRQSDVAEKIVKVCEEECH